MGDLDEKGLTDDRANLVQEDSAMVVLLAVMVSLKMRFKLY